MDENILSNLTFFSNRASSNFYAALVPLGAKPYCAGMSKIDFLYFDTYGGKAPPIVTDVRHSLINRQKTIQLDNKALFAKRLIEGGLCAPIVYFDPEEIPNDPDKLWFIKDPLSTAGKSVHVVRSHEIREFFKPGYIIQEGVTDIDLINGKKFTIRIYILVHDMKIFIYPEGFLVIHGLKYDPASNDFSVQVDHRGYENPASDVTMQIFSSYKYYKTLFKNIVQTAPDIFRLFSRSLSDSSDRYCLFGVDYLCRKDHSPALIEVNDRPNLLHTPEINRKVNIGMIRDMVVLILKSKLLSSIQYKQRFSLIGALV